MTKSAKTVITSVYKPFSRHDHRCAGVFAHTKTTFFLIEKVLLKNDKKHLKNEKRYVSILAVKHA